MNATQTALDRRFKLGAAGWLAAFLLVAWIPALSFAGHWSFDEPFSTFVPSLSDARELLPGHDHDPGQGHDTALHQESPALPVEPGASPDDASHAEHGHAGLGASLVVIAAPSAPLAAPVSVRSLDAAALDDASLTGFDSRPLVLPPR